MGKPYFKDVLEMDADNVLNKVAIGITCAIHFEEILHHRMVLLPDTVNEMLEIITVSLAAEPFHDVTPVTGLAFPVFRELVIVLLTLAEKVGTDEAKILIADEDLSGRDLAN